MIMITWMSNGESLYVIFNQHNHDIPISSAKKNKKEKKQKKN